jgi:hypothetical protein
MPRVDAATLQQVAAAFLEYEAELAASKLSASAKRAYVYEAAKFVRWLNGDCVPGSRLWSPAMPKG